MFLSIKIKFRQRHSPTETLTNKIISSIKILNNFLRNNFSNRFKGFQLNNKKMLSKKKETCKQLNEIYFLHAGLNIPSKYL